MTGQRAEDEAETAALICEILAGLLGRESVDPAAGFRDLGGDSLRAVKAAGRIAVEFATADETNERLLEALLDGAAASELALLVEGAGALGISVHARRQTVGRPLSYGEERLWLAQCYHETPAYHVVNAFRVTGDLQLAVLDRAVEAVVARHPALRTRYDSAAPWVVDEGDAVAGASGVDIVHSHRRMAWRQALALATASAAAPFDLAQGRLLRVRSYLTGERERLLLVMVHHIATDGWSMDLIYREISDLYAGRLQGPAPPGYGGFASWQRTAPKALAAVDAFAARLVPLPERLELAGSRQRPPVRSMAGRVLHSRLSAVTTGRLQALASRTGSSLYEVLIAVFYLCLARRSRQWDLLIGTVASARTLPGFHHTVGFFANTLPVRVTADLDTAISDLLARVRAEVRWVLTHQEVPLEEIVLRVRRSPDRAHSPLVDAALILQNDGVTLPAFGNCAITPIPLHTGTAKFDLTLEITPAADTGALDLNWEYATDVLAADLVADLTTSFALIADALVKPGATVRSATGLGTAERRRARSICGPARERHGTDVSALFDRLATAGPTLPAVLEGTGTVDRAGLRTLRDQVTGCLAARGIGPGDVVAIHLPRSAWSVAALLGAWRLGAVPVLIDIHHPAKYRGELIKACRARAVLTCEIRGWAAGTPVVSLTEAARCASPPPPPVRRAPDDAAWLVATSGSTGKPRITVGTHRGLRNRCAWAWETFPYDESDVVALRTPVGFVDAIAEAAVPLLAGVPLAIVPDRGMWDARELTEVLARHRVTRLLSTPSMLQHLLHAVPDLGTVVDSLRWCSVSGEPLGTELLSRLRAALPGCRVVNLYGSSEVAGDATCAEVTGLPEGRPVPIGRPISNTRVLVADDDGELVPPGSVGELVVMGDPVGLGYVEDGKLTQSGGFRSWPDGSAGYWTGDLGWVGTDGLLYFAGRRDRLVKINGCRVELGQVEAALQGLPGVRNTVAWTDRAAGGTERICAAVVPVDGTDQSVAALSAQLRDRLPGYMVPARIAATMALPLNANGKLDRSEAARLTAQRECGTGGPPPMSGIQRHLWELWTSLLGEEPTGLDDDFFGLGGDSLAANTMLAAVMRDPGVALDVGDFLAEPTIRALAASVVRAQATGCDSGMQASQEVRAW
jgi:amino acid adenylation domain-containing protein